MIKIINYKDLKDDFFNGRDFGSSIDIVKDIISPVTIPGIICGKTTLKNDFVGLHPKSSAAS